MTLNKKIISFTVTICLLAASFFAVPILSDAATQYYAYTPNKEGVTTVAVNLRTGSSTSYSKITTVPKGKTVTIYGYDEVPGYNWYKVKYGNKTGYMRSDYVKVTETSSDSSSQYYDYNPDKKGVTTVALNMRTGSSTSHSKIVTIPKGKSLVIYGYDEVPGYNWYKVKYGNKTGYVRRDYVNITGNMSSSEDTEVPESTMAVKNHTKPSGSYKEGAYFTFKGEVYSNLKISSIEIGVVDSNGKKMDSCYEVVKPNSTSYDIKNVDRALKFNELTPGTYTYKVVATDAGATKTLISQSFTIKSSSVTTEDAGKVLSYNSANFKRIGKQPVSGPCGLYSMAYGRLVLDGSFTVKSSPSVHKQLQQKYGNGTDLAYWGDAGAYSVWTSNAKEAYQNVLKEINAGRPCIIPVNGPYGQHFMTVIGYTKGTTAANVSLSRLIVLDPAYGTQVTGTYYGYWDKPASQARYIKFKW